jgi:protein-disulfide isomerase
VPRTLERRTSSTTNQPRQLGERAATAGRLTLAAVFGWAALSKITDPDGTVRSVRAYRLLPEALATTFGRGLPWMELALAVLLALGLALRLTAALTAGLLAVFTGAIVSAAARGLRIDCGCFGSGGPTENPHYAGEIGRDLALTATAAALAWFGRSHLAVGPRPPLAPHEATDRQARAAAVRHQAAVAAYRRSQRIVAIAAAGTVLAAGFTGVAVGAAGAPGAPTAVPAGVTAAGGIVVGSPSAPHTIVAYEDPQCPICGQFERTSGQTLAAAVEAGAVRVEYRMRSFLGPESVRADAALGAAQDEGKFAALRAALFAHQPAERTGGFTIADLISLGASVGLTDSRYVDAVRHQTYAAWAREVDNQASRDGNTGTPELILDGHELSQSVAFDPTALQAAIMSPAAAPAR